MRIQMVNPRGCGGSGACRGGGRCRVGQSPRVRGKPCRIRCSEPPARSIPAGAGEAAKWPPIRAPTRVNPRGCGGSSFNGATLCPSRGQSPRVRGKLVSRPRRACRLGSIPAGAGEAPSPRQQGGRSPVNPRGCGGSTPPLNAVLTMYGQSPRVRGKRYPDVREIAGTRSIPAGAGEAPFSTRRLGTVPVNPRGCGGSLPYPAASRRKWGQSPRVRGKPSRVPPASLIRRSIPAGAGEAGRDESGAV